MIRQLFEPDTCTYTYLLWDPASREAALIDPVRETLDRDLRLVEELELTLRYVLETHVHADHVTSSGVIADRTGAKTVSGVGGAECADLHLEHGAELALGTLTITALATPGHTPDSTSFAFENDVFTGDALFIRGNGRTDFQGGDAGSLYDAITGVLFELPADTRVWPGHDYKGQTSSTIDEERRLNPRVAGKSRDQFVEIMANLNLSPPRFIDIAVPANRRCGRAEPDPAS
jgi:glyoxylase-like metal-dependent hydrolase (beta-lactamase superfamily II)